MGEHKLFRTGNFRWMIAVGLLASAVPAGLITNFGYATNSFNMGVVANQPNVSVQGIPFDEGEGSTTDFLHGKITYSRYQEKKESVEVGEGDAVEEVEVTVINPVDGKPEIEAADAEIDAWRYIEQRFENGVCSSSSTNNAVLDLEWRRCVAGKPGGMEGFAEPVGVDNVSEVATCSSLSRMPYNGLITGINPSSTPTDAQNIAMLYNTWYLQSLIRCASELRSNTTEISLPGGEIYFVGGNQYQPHMKEVVDTIWNIVGTYINNGSGIYNNAQVETPLTDETYIRYCKIASLGYRNYQDIIISDQTLNELMAKEPYLESAESCREQVEQFRAYYNNLTSVGTTGVQDELRQKVYQAIYNIAVNKVVKERSAIKLYDRINLAGTSLDTVLKPYNQIGNNELDMFLYDNLSTGAMYIQIINGYICLRGANDSSPSCIDPSGSISSRNTPLNIFKIKVNREEREEEESGEGGGESGNTSEGGESSSEGEDEEEDDEIFNPLDGTKVTNRWTGQAERAENVLQNGETISAPQYTYRQDYYYNRPNVTTEVVAVNFGQSLQNANFSNFKVDGEDALGNGNRVGNNRAVGTGFTVNLFENVKWNNVTVQNMDATGFALSSPMGANNEINNSRAFGNGKHTSNTNASDVSSIKENGNGAGFGIDIGYNTYRAYNDGEMSVDNLPQGYRCAVYSSNYAGRCLTAIKEGEQHALKIDNSAAIGNATFGFLFQNKNRFQTGKYYGIEGDYAVTNSLAASNAINYGGIRANNVSFSNDVSLTSLNELSSLNVGGNTWGANALEEALPADSNDNGSYKHSNGTLTSTRRNTYFSNDSTELGLSSADGESGIKVVDTAFQDNGNSNTWYYDAITWAEEKGIIGGYDGGIVDSFGSNNFGLKQNITLSQALQLFWRMEGFEDEVISETNRNLSGKEPVLYYGGDDNGNGVQTQRFDNISFCYPNYFRFNSNWYCSGATVTGDLSKSMETRAILWGWGNEMFIPEYEVYYAGDYDSVDKNNTITPWTNSYVRVGQGKTLTRGDFLRIMYLYSKNQDASYQNTGSFYQDYVGFSDLPDDTNEYYAAIRWANMNYITDGAYIVSPTNLIKYQENCTMEQALAFLYRYWMNFRNYSISDSAPLENLLDVCHNIAFGSDDRASCEEQRKATCTGELKCDDMFVLTPPDNGQSDE